MEILNHKSPEIISLLEKADKTLNLIHAAFKKRTPLLEGEKYLSNKDVGRMLQMSIRTLQDWRDHGRIDYIQISGKILYRESDILKLLEDNYYKSWRDE